MGKIIAVSNMKINVFDCLIHLGNHITIIRSGVGKTTTALGLGAGLARQGNKVLCLDADAQHSLTISFGIAEPNKLQVTLSTMMSSIINETEFDPLSGIISHLEGVDLLPANNTLAGLEIALAAADSVIIPVVPKYLDAKGLELLLKSIAQIKRQINPNIEIGGILLTMVDRRANLCGKVAAAYSALTREVLSDAA